MCGWDSWCPSAQWRDEGRAPETLAFNDERLSSSCQFNHTLKITTGYSFIWMEISVITLTAFLAHFFSPTPAYNLCTALCVSPLVVRPHSQRGWCNSQRLWEQSKLFWSISENPLPPAAKTVYCLPSRPGLKFRAHFLLELLPMPTSSHLLPVVLIKQLL